MSKLACWAIIKDGCNTANQNALAAAQNQTDTLYYEDEIPTALPRAEQDQIAALVADVVNSSQHYRNKTSLLREFLKTKANEAVT